MDSGLTPKKKLKSPGIDVLANINIKTSVTCLNIPEALLEPSAAKKHFSKFGRVQKIKLFAKKKTCIVEYDHPLSAGRAVLNAGAYDGFMFDVTRTKPRTRRMSKKDDDPDWVPDSDVEEELSAMSGAPTYRISRQKPMDLESSVTSPAKVKMVKKLTKPSLSPAKHKSPIAQRKPVMAQPISGRESPVAVVSVQTTMSLSEAASELHQLRFKMSLTPDEQWRTLDARDRILRAWGGSGSRVKVGGATIGTCPDMCPEKELLHRQAEFQVMTLETVPDSDGQLDRGRAIKQYSRSSADQEIPMCYELRPARVLMRTCAYLLNEIADTKRQVTLADWFHFMWDRLRSIRKDITQQALCCAESICLVEMCARFHAHCAASLADLEHTQFDQRLNTDNLTKCLQTLKHMYADVGPEDKPREAEFRGYIALLNLGDANFWWEIKQLPQDIQASEAINFALQVFNALDNNNYVKFFRLVNQKATYLQACILLRYFNDVRARALARIVKAYAPRGGSRYPARELMNSLAFESTESMKSFINHYGLRFGKDEHELTVILDRNQFIEDMDPYPVARHVNLIESKRRCTVGETIAGGHLPHYNPNSILPYSSFNVDGKLKELALVAEDQGYNTLNDTNKDVNALKTEIQRLSKGERSYGSTDRIPEPKVNLFARPESKAIALGKLNTVKPQNNLPANYNNASFSFKPAIPVAPTEIIKNSPEKMFDHETKNAFSFSKPQNSFSVNDTGSLFSSPGTALSDFKPEKPGIENKDPFQKNQSVFKKAHDNVFKRSEDENSVFGPIINRSENKLAEPNKSIFGQLTSKNIFTKKVDETDSHENTFRVNNIFSKQGNLFAKDEVSQTKPESSIFGGNIFAKAVVTQDINKNPANVFGSFKKAATPESNSTFVRQENDEASLKSNLIIPNGNVITNNLSPASLFKSANSSDNKPYSIFQSKNKAPTLADNIFNSLKQSNSQVYDFDSNEEKTQNYAEVQRLNEEKLNEEREREIKLRLQEEEEKRKELERKQEEVRKQEEAQKQEEIKRLEEKRKREEERKQEELRKRLEAERQAEMKRKADEEDRKFKARVDRESKELVDELVSEIRDETIREILTDEMEKMKNLMKYAEVVTEEIWLELCDEISVSELKAEKLLTEKLMKKWFHMWRRQFVRNYKRRTLLEETPVWLPDKVPVQEAADLRRAVENAVLKNMNAIHRGYRFSGELQLLPTPETYKIIEIIRSPLLKRMKQINYPYDKCFFWKIALIIPTETEWLSKKIELKKWLLDVFSDKTNHDTSETLIYVQKQSWNNLMDFAISVSLANGDDTNRCSEALDGTNGVLFYFTEKQDNHSTIIEETLKLKYPYQKVPVVVILPKIENSNVCHVIEQTLTNFSNDNKISAFKIFVLDSSNIFESLNSCTKSSLKWLAKKCPENPMLEVDYLMSICQRYLGKEIWCKLKYERDNRMNNIMKDLAKLVKCYNAAVDKLTSAITNEDLFNYPTFPLEFNEYLDHTSPYPKPFEFIPTNARNSDNASAIKETMEKLKLQMPDTEFHPLSVVNMHDQIRNYCHQLRWFEDPEQVVCKVVALMPSEFSELDMPCEKFNRYFEQYDLVDLLNIIVYEKLGRLSKFDNRHAIYEKSALENYSHINWLYDTEVLSSLKHKALDYDDELDLYIEVKRQKLAEESMECLMLEDNDCTLVEENINVTESSITRYSNCANAVRQLEEQIEEERKKSTELENLLKSALSNV